MTGRRNSFAAAAAVVGVCVLIVLLLTKDAKKPPYPASHLVTVRELRGALDASGLQIRYFPGKTLSDGTGVLGGVASFGRSSSRVGFEFAVDRHAPGDVDALGHAGLPLRRDPQSGTPTSTADGTSRGVEPEIRGVLANVAYANYVLGRDPYSASEQRVSERLDRVLFSVFPHDDAVAFPVRQEP